MADDIHNLAIEAKEIIDEDKSLKNFLIKIGALCPIQRSRLLKAVLDEMDRRSL